MSSSLAAAVSYDLTFIAVTAVPGPTPSHPLVSCLSLSSAASSRSLCYTAVELSLPREVCSDADVNSGGV